MSKRLSTLKDNQLNINKYNTNFKSMKAVRNIEEMSNWDILTYLRTERNWMVQTHYLRQ